MMKRVSVALILALSLCGYALADCHSPIIGQVGDTVTICPGDDLVLLSLLDAEYVVTVESDDPLTEIIIQRDPCDAGWVITAASPGTTTLTTKRDGSIWLRLDSAGLMCAAVTVQPGWAVGGD